MAVALPKVIYNFNEDSGATIRDYSENGSDGTATGLTNQASSRVGREVVFNATTDQIDMGNITDLNGVADMAFTMGVKFNAGSGLLNVFEKSGQVEVTFNYTGNILKFGLIVASGTATVSATLVIDTYYDISVSWTSNTLVIEVDGVIIDTDNTETGVVASNANNMYIGDDSGSNSANFTLNEFKLFDQALIQDNVDAFILEQNGVRIVSGSFHEYALGDIIVSNINTSIVQYAVVTFIESTTVYRMQPLTDNISMGSLFTRVAHLWDTTRQWMFIIDDTPQISFYDGVSKSSEVLSASKKIYCLNRDGIIKSSSTKTTTYQVLSKDQRIYIDTATTGAFTVTLEASPATNRELEIIDSVGNNGTANLTIGGGGNNINGSANYTSSTNYEYMILVFNGANWNLK